MYYASGGFANFIDWLYQIGVADVLLPFLLVFVIVYAILQKTKILGTDPGTKRFNVVIAIVLGLAVIFPHIYGWYGTFDPVEVINNALPNVAIILIAILAFLILLGAFGVKYTIAEKNIGAVISVIAIIVVIYIFGAAAGWGWRIPRALSFLEDPQVYVFLIIIIVFGLVIAYITHEPGSGGQKESKVMKFFREPLEKA